MKTVKTFWSTLFIVLIASIFVSCSENNEELNIPDNPPAYEEVSGKYEITDVSSPYESVELLESGDYIIIKRVPSSDVNSSKSKGLLSNELSKATISNMIYGTFTQLEDGSFDLEGFGVIKLISNDNKEITSISIKPDNEDEMIFNAKKCEEMGNDEQTNALCRKWKVVKIREVETHNGEIISDNTENPDEIIAQEITFSKSGIFIVYNPGENTSNAFYWKWENQQKSQIGYTKDDTWSGENDNFTVEISENKLIIHEKYEEHSEESDEYYTREKIIELVEKNSITGGGDDESNLPVDKTPIEKVFDGKLLNEIKCIERKKTNPEIGIGDYGKPYNVYNYKLAYENGFLTEFLTEYFNEESSEVSENERIVFEYNYFNSDKSASEPDVRYTIFRNGRKSNIYEVKLNKQGFAEFIDEVNGIDLLPISRTVCQYDEEGHLVFIYKNGSEKNITWKNGDITEMNGRTFTYYDTLNSDNLMFWGDIYNDDYVEENKNLTYLYWAGLLGFSTKHLVSTSYPYAWDSSSNHKWETNKLIKTYQTEAYVHEKTILYSFTN